MKALGSICLFIRAGTKCVSQKVVGKLAFIPPHAYVRQRAERKIFTGMLIDLGMNGKRW